MNTEEIEKTKMLPANDVPGPQDTYRIFTYLDQHHSLLIACVSALVAIISALFNIVAYVYQKITLRGWNIDFRIINFSVKGQLYYFVFFSLVYIVSILLFTSLVQKIFTKYIRCSAYVTYYKHTLKKLKADFTSRVRQFAKFERRLKKMTHVQSEETTTSLVSIGEQKEELEVQIKAVRQDIRKLRRNIIKDMLSGLLAAIILFLPIMFAYQITTSNSSWTIVVVSWFFCFVITMSTAYIRARRVNKDIAPKKIKEMVDKSWSADIEERDRVKAKVFEATNVHTPPRTIGQTLSDQNLSRIAVNLFSVFFTLLVTITLMGLTNSIGQTEYWIYTDESQQYVVVYQDETRCILKEAETDGNNLIVNISRQKVVGSDNILLVSRKFSKVEKVNKE